MALAAVRGRIGRYRIALRSLDDATVKAEGWDPGQTEINARLAIGGQPAQGMVVLNSDGSFTYTPNATFTGADSFSFTNLAKATYVLGDAYVNAGTVIGGNDTISIARTGAFHIASLISTVSGDIYAANSPTLTKGGNDMMSIRDANVSQIVGDTFSSGGNLTGGDDKIVYASSAPIFTGPPALAPAIPRCAAI